jgi:hypothetical protein
VPQYVAIVSKGFQHQFWQAVQKGATDEAAKLGATITYEGPASESEVDKQLTMLQTALDKKPAAICFAALDSKAAQHPDPDQDGQHPVIVLDSGVDSDIPLTRRRPTTRRRPPRPRSRCASSSGAPAPSASSFTTRCRSPVPTVATASSRA